MTRSCDILNATFSLLVKAALLAARPFGRVTSYRDQARPRTSPHPRLVTPVSEPLRSLEQTGRSREVAGEAATKGSRGKVTRHHTDPLGVFGLKCPCFRGSASTTGLHLNNRLAHDLAEAAFP